MNIDEVYIHRRRLRKRLWREEIKDDQLVEFFRQEEELEDRRASEWADDTGEDLTKFDELNSVSEIVRDGLGLG